MPTKDNIAQPAKPLAHADTHPPERKKYEHPDITDNRLTWEVLKEADKNG